MIKTIITIGYILLPVILLSCSTAGPTGPPEAVDETEDGVFRGAVVQVIDGDSLVVRVNRERRRISLYGIDCPENDQAYGNAARYWVNMLVFHEEVRIRPVPPENFGEVPALIYFGDDRCLNQELVMAGLAWVDQKACQRAECAGWSDGERKARSAGVGLWKDRDPMPPWKWRDAR